MRFMNENEAVSVQQPSEAEQRNMCEGVACGAAARFNLDPDRSSRHVQALADQLHVVPVTETVDTPKRRLTITTGWVVAARDPQPDVFGGTGGEMALSQQLRRMVEALPEHRALVRARG